MLCAALLSVMDAKLVLNLQKERALLLTFVADDDKILLKDSTNLLLGIVKCLVIPSGPP